MIEGAPQPEVPAAGEEPVDQFTVINEDTGHAVVEEPAAVKITAMVPPTPEPETEPAVDDEDPPEESVAVHEDEVVEPVIAVAMAAPPAFAEEPVEEIAAAGDYLAEEPPAQPEYADPQPEYAEPEYAQPEYAQPEQPAYEGYEVPAEGYAAEAPTETWEQPPAQQAYYDPAQQQAPVPPPVPVPAPSFAPPLPAPPPMQQQPRHQQPAQYGYAPPPVAPGYHMPGHMPGPYGGGFAPQRSVPGWALILVGVLVGFLVAMSIFKFTSMGAALRGDLIEEGEKKAEKKYKAQIKALKNDGYSEAEEEEEPEEPAPTEEEEKVDENAEDEAEDQPEE